MKKLLTIILIIVLILCGIKFLTSCGNEYNGVEYDYDGVIDLKNHLDDSANLVGKKIFLKEYVIEKNPLVSDFYYIALNESTKLTITDKNGDDLPDGTYSVPILIEIKYDMTVLGRRAILAEVIG